MATTFKVRIFQNEVNQLLHGRQGPVVLHQANLGRQAAGIARRIAPRKTGRLASNIDSKLVPDAKGYHVELVAGVPYALYVHGGTRPHRIDGNPLLVFYWPKAGRTMFLPHVNHPGTRPQPFLLQAVRQLGLNARAT